MKQNKMIRKQILNLVQMLNKNKKKFCQISKKILRNNYQKASNNKKIMKLEMINKLKIIMVIKNKLINNKMNNRIKKKKKTMILKN